MIDLFDEIAGFARQLDEAAFPDEMQRADGDEMRLASKLGILEERSKRRKPFLIPIIEDDGIELFEARHVADALPGDLGENDFVTLTPGRDELPNFNDRRVESQQGIFPVRILAFLFAR